MNYHKFTWKSAALLASTLALTTNLNAQTSSSTVALIASDPSALAGTTSGAFTLVRYGDVSSDLTVNVDVAGTAANGVDYTTLGTVFVLPAGTFALDVPVVPLLGNTNRGNKTVIMTLETNSTYRIKGNHTATVKIVDDVFDIAPPTVSVSSPADGSVFTMPASVTLQADVSDPDLPITSVSFYADDVLLTKLTNSPFTFVWDHPRKGKYTVFARAVSEFGKSTISSPIDVTISDVPVVTVVQPFQVATSGEIVPLTAQIGDPNEPISSVKFYMNGKLVDTETAAPFVYNWPTAALGTFSFQAIAVDANTGKKGTSAKISMQVTGNFGN